MTLKTPRGELKQVAAVGNLKEEKCQVGGLHTVQVGVELIFYISGKTRMVNELYQTATVVYRTLHEAEIPSGFHFTPLVNWRMKAKREHFV